MSDVVEQITQYLTAGGFFNPELMEHDKVLDLLIKCRDEITRLREELRWIPVTDQLPPDDTDVDFLCVRGYDGYGHIHRDRKDWCEKYNLPYDPTPTMTEYEGGPYYIGKDDFGNWGVTHWRLRPGVEPDFDKFFEDNK